MSQLKKISPLIAIWCLAIAISVISFYHHWNSWPHVVDIVFGHSLYAILAMPFSFVHNISFFGDNLVRIDGLQFAALILGYWAVLIYLHVKYLRTGRTLFLLPLSFILIISAFRWLIYATGMSGI